MAGIIREEHGVVDFNKLNSSRSQSAPTDPIKIFQRLPKPPHINDLWESQNPRQTQVGK